MCRNAAAARRRRSARVKPPAATAARTSPYRAGSTTTATDGWFFAAARTIAGPPMSICSTHSSGRGARGDRLGERVEVDHDQVERGDAELVELGHVLGLAAVGEDARVHRRVQRLHPPVEALGEAGDLLDRRDRDAGVGDPARGRPGAHQLHAGRGEPGGELLDAGLVVDAQQGAADRRPVGHRGLSLGRCGDDLRHRLHQELALHGLDPLVQPRLVVPGQDGDLPLGEHGTGVDPGVDDVHRRARDRHPGGQRVADGVRAREGRQQGRVGVDQAAAERAEHRRADQLHEAGGDDEVRLEGARARRPGRGPRRRGPDGRPARR